MKSIILLLLTVGFMPIGLAQNYNQSQKALENFLVRMYKSAPFEGVKVVADYENSYLLSVILVKKSTNSTESSMNRIAQLKSSRQVSQYLNGIISTESETIIHTTENTKTQKSIEEIIDVIRENSIGFTKAMEVLTTFDANDIERCYMFYRKVEEMNR